MPNRSKFLALLAGIVFVVFLWSAIRPHDSFTWFLEVLPVLIAVPVLGATYRRFPLTSLAYGLIALHAIVLMIGGHYTYAEVPWFNWLRDTFHLARNHYDRVGHFLQGFVPALLVREILLRTTPLKPGKMLAFLVVCVCLAISASYELFEWAVAEATGEAADSFLGTQGDPWDTQKDMALALFGAVVSLLLWRRWHDRAVAQIQAAHRA